MTPITYQTVKLRRGKHQSPSDGVCVMELASMIAGEPFTDQPASVCPVIGAFLRAYNDAIDDERRQDLYEYAAKVVGSRGPEAVRRARADRLAVWGSALGHSGWKRFFLPRWVGVLQGAEHASIGTLTVRAIRRHTDGSHAEVLGMIDELLALGAADAPASPVPTPAAAAGHAGEVRPAEARSGAQAV